MDRYALLDNQGRVCWASSPELFGDGDPVGRDAWGAIAPDEARHNFMLAVGQSLLIGEAGPLSVHVASLELRVMLRRIKEPLAIIATWQRVPEFKLTPRELDVARCMTTGKPTRESAYGLGIGVSSFETHRRSVLGKTGCNGPGDLTRWLVDRGLVPLMMNEEEVDV